jgi:hypothetical protein
MYAFFFIKNVKLLYKLKKNLKKIKLIQKYSYFFFAPAFGDFLPPPGDFLRLSFVSGLA